MPNCTHCGKPAGLFRSYHAECRAQFERATTTIPAFFERLLQSRLPSDRFEQLLKEVAATFHIGPDQLRSLSIAGINAMMDSAIAQHLPTAAEEDRILDIAATLGLSVSDIPGLVDKFMKISILRELDEGKIPDCVTVVGPMPFEFGPDETIVWIFNGVKSVRPRKQNEPAPARPSPPARDEMPHYFSLASLGDQSARLNNPIDVSSGDLILTNRHIFIVSDERHRQISLSKVVGVNPYSDGFQIVRLAPGDRPDKSLTFVMDDPWFGINLVVRLVRSSADITTREAETGPADI